MPLLACPDRRELDRLSLGLIDDAEAADFEQHLESCDSCQAAFQSASARDGLVEALRHTRPAAVPAAEVASVVERLKRPVSTPAGIKIMPAQPATLPLGSLIRDYRLHSLLGKGGMGSVYKAEHTRLKRVVALKVLVTERVITPDAVARFAREMQAVGALDHPNIVRAFDAGDYEGQHYLVMELVEGCDANGLVAQAGPLPIADACEVIRQAAVGLAHAHAAGLVHRDIKPHNLMVSRAGVVKILDLGLALVREASEGGPGLTTSGVVMGTIDYMAPEQADDTHEVDARADLYSLGATLYRLLTGRAPIATSDGDSVLKKLMALATSEPAPLAQFRPDAPEALADALARALARSPDDRFQSAAELASALAPFCAGADLPGLVERADTVSAEKRADQDTLAIFQVNDKTDRPAPREMPAPSRPQPASDSRGGAGTPVWWWAAGGCGAAALALAAILFFWQTPQGTVRIEILDPAITATIDKQGVQVTGADRQPITIQAGDHTLLFKRGDLQFETSSFRLRKDGELTIRIELIEGEVRASQNGAVIGSRPVPGAIALRPASPPRPEAVVQTSTKPISPLALVTEPAALPGLVSWTVETRAHRGHIEALAWNREGNRIATAAHDGSARVWDAASGKLLHVFLHESPLNAVAWSPDGRQLATGSFNQEVLLWDLESGQARRLPKHGFPSRMAWSPSGKLLAVGTRESRVNVYDPAAGKLVDGLVGHTGQICGLAWSADSKSLASTCLNKVLRIWNGETLALRRELAGITEPGSALAWSPDGGTLAFGNGQVIKSWTVDSGKRLADVKTASPIMALAFVPEGKQIISGGADGTSELWNAEDGKLARTFEKGNFYRPSAMQWSPDGLTLAAASMYGSIWAWEPKPAHMAFAVEGQRMYSDTWNQKVAPLAWSPKGNRLAVNHECGRVEIWDFVAGTHQFFSGAAGPGTALAWSPSGESLASGGADSVVRVWDLERSKEGQMTYLKGGWVYSLAWLPDGKSLYVGCQGHEIRLWAIAKPEATLLLKEHQSGVTTLALTKDGSRLISGDFQGKICIWDPKKPRPLHVLKHGANIRSIALAASGDFFVSASDGEAIRVWNTASGELLETIQDKGDAECLAVGLSPDGANLAYGSLSDRKVRIWSLTKKARTRSLEPSLTSRIMSVGWSADGSTIAATSENDNRVCLWDVAGGKHRETLFAMTTPHAFRLSPRGHVAAGKEALANLVYVAQTNGGQETLSAEEFATKYDWKNGPKSPSK